MTLKRKSVLAVFATVSILISSIVFYSCKRSADLPLPQETQTSLSKEVDYFFDATPSLHPSVLAVQRSLKAYEAKQPFLAGFIDRNGLPSWSGAMIATKRGQVGNARSGEEAPEQRQVLYVPFSDPNKAAATTSILRVVIDGTDTTMRMIYPQSYKRLGFDAPAEGKWNAKDLFSLFAMFDKEIYGIEKHIVEDGRIFGREQSQKLITHSAFAVDSQVSSSSGRMVSYTVCSSVTSCVYASENPEPALDVPNCTTTTTCNTYYFDDGSDPYGTGGGEYGGGSGSGTNPGPINENPCGGGGGGGGAVDRLPEEGGGGDDPCDPAPWQPEIEGEPSQICPENFDFVSVTTNNSWLEAHIKNVYSNIIIFATSNRQVQIPDMYFGVAYTDVNGNLIYSKNEAKEFATIAFNKGELDMRALAKAQPTMPANQLGDYFIKRADYWLKQLTLNRGAVTKNGSQNPTRTVPIKYYVPDSDCSQ